MTACPWADTNWAGAWTGLDIGIDSFGSRQIQFGQGYGQNWTKVCTGSCTYIRKAL